MASLWNNFFGGQAGDPMSDMLTPEQQAAINRQSMLALGAKLLQASGRSAQPMNFSQALGGALSAGLEAQQSGQANAVQQMLMRQKLQDAKTERERQTSYMDMLRGGPASAPAGAMPAGAMPAGAMPAPVAGAPTAAPSQGQVNSMVANLTDQQRAILATMPMDQGMKFLLEQSVPKEDPTSIREYQLAQQQGFKGSFLDFKNMVKPSTTVNLPPGPNQFVGAAGGVASARLEAGLNAAEAANSTLRNIDLITPALDTAVLGPAADYRTTMLRVGQQLGIAGTDANQVLSDTRQVVQGLARSELDAAAGMKGQGQITESERALLRRTAAGDQNMTAAEIRTSMAAMQKLANQRLASYQQLLQTSQNIPGFQQIAPMFQLTPYQSQFNLGTSLNTGGNQGLGDAIQRELDKRRASGGAR
jgi:hypothetical protein